MIHNQDVENQHQNISSGFQDTDAADEVRSTGTLLCELYDFRFDKLNCVLLYFHWFEA